ncbi:MAG: phage baseplate assembly protein V [Bacteroidales bacterium]
MKFKYVAYDYLNEKILSSGSGNKKVSKISDKAEVAKKSSDKLYSHETQSLYNHSLSESNATAQLDERVKLEKSGLIAGLISLNGGSDNPTLVLGGQISIQESIKQDGNKIKKVDHGTYIITGLSHTCDRNGNYQNIFSAIPEKVDVPPFTTPHAIPFCETQSAKVMDNNDPDKLGRIKVQFFWQQIENTTSPWLRVLTPHSGLKKGFYFIPEIDDEVLVGFEGGNAEKPYIIGSLYNGKAKPDTLFDPDNNIKAIRTRSGHTIEFIDEDGKEELKIYDFEKKNYEIILASHSKEITIVSQGDIGITAEGNMNIKVTGDMDMEATGDMKIKANNIQMESNMDLEMKATNAKIEAQSNYEVKGTMVKTEASASMDVKAGAKMSINGGALLEQKGGLIKIN